MLNTKARVLFVVALLLPCANVCFANVGIFSGHGHTVELSSTGSIQMVSEDVLIIPYPQENYPEDDPYAPGIKCIDYHCVFHLKNLVNEEQTIQVGFPLNADSIKYTRFKDDRPDEELSKYNFTAHVEDLQYEVRYVPGNMHQNLEHLFLWDMHFRPGESKMLEVCYSLPASHGLGSTDRSNWSTDYSKESFRELSLCVATHFGYVTKTGNSWSGPIEKAVFRVYLKELDAYFRNRPLRKNKIQKRFSWEKRETENYLLPSNPASFWYIEPEGWAMHDDGFMTMELENYQPTENLMFCCVLLLGFQRSLDSVLPSLLKKDWNGEDYLDFADILKEYNGITTNNSRIHSFIKNQMWYGKEKIQYVANEVIWAYEFIGYAMQCVEKGVRLLGRIAENIDPHDKQAPI